MLLAGCGGCVSQLMGRVAFPSWWGVPPRRRLGAGRLYQSRGSLCVPGHVQFGVPGLINHAPRCKGKVMEVGLGQQGIAAASHRSSFGQHGQRVGGERGHMEHRAGFPPACPVSSALGFPLPTEGNQLAAPPSARLSPSQGAQWEAEHRPTGRREPERLIQRGVKLWAAAAAPGTIPLSRPLRGRVGPRRRGAVPGAAAAAAPAGAGLGALLARASQRRAARGQGRPAQGLER